MSKDPIILVICPSCGQETDPGNMTNYHGPSMCEGCAESIADYASGEGMAPGNDPHGRGWGNNNGYCN